MFRPGVDESDVQMTDVLCDFCHRAWSEDRPFIEGHRGAVICGNCLSIAYAEVVNHKADDVTEGYFCRMCREGDEDRTALKRGGEPGWRSPVDEEAAICRKCIKLAAGTLQKDPDLDWKRPE